MRHNRQIDTEDFIRRNFGNTHSISFYSFIAAIQSDFKQLWADSDDQLLKDITQKLKSMLCPNSNHIDVRVLRARSKQGIMSMLLDAIKQLNSSSKSTFDNISDILPKSQSQSISKQSILSDHFLKDGLQPIKSYLTECANSLTQQAFDHLTNHFQHMNSVLLNNIHHYEKVLRALERKGSEVNEKKRLQGVVKQMGEYIVKLQGMLEGQRAQRPVEKAKRRVTLDTRLLSHHPEQKKSPMFACKQNTNRHNFRY